METPGLMSDVTGHTPHSSRRIFPERNSNFSQNQDFSTDSHIRVKIRINHSVSVRTVSLKLRPFNIEWLCNITQLKLAK